MESQDVSLATIAEISQELSLAPKTLYSWVALKKIPFIKLGRAVRFDRREIQTWILAKREVNHGAK